MLSNQYPSRNKKTGAIATTYRAGKNNIFGSCPKTCNLCERPAEATNKIDFDYMGAVYDAVPKGGRSFSYTHFHYKKWFAKYPNKKGKTIFNFSADTIRSAEASLKKGVATVVATTKNKYEKAKARGVKIQICPADKDKGFNCANCGGSKGPICSWANRDFIVAFITHGPKTALANSQEKGGCYAESGFHTRIHWNWLSNREAVLSDSQQVKEFASSLPFGTTLRHHIAGDMGKV